MKIQDKKSVVVALLLCFITVVTVVFCYTYFQTISSHVYKDSSQHLIELYSQVTRNFTIFMEKDMESLNDYTVYWDGIDDEESFVKYINEQRKQKGFSKFYFLSRDGRGITSDGTAEQFSHREYEASLFEQQKSVVCNDTLSDNQTVALFAMPVETGSYMGFVYDAVAISYTNADIISALNMDNFSGRSVCLVVQTDGDVILSTHSDGAVFKNYLSYLSVGSDIGEEDLKQMSEDWENGISGILRCHIGQEDYYISYNPVPNADFVLLGIVPDAVVSAGMSQVQSITIDMLVKIFILIGSIVIILLIYTFSKKAKKNTMELYYREFIFDAVSQNVDDIFLMVDGKTRKVDYISPNIERLLGISKDDAKENFNNLIKECSVGEDYFVDDDTLNSIPINDKHMFDRELKHKKTNEVHWFHETVYHENIHGEKKFIVVMSDRTDDRKNKQTLEEALVLAKNANEAKSNFLSNMSHDIRTPMNAIVGYATLLEKDTGNAEKVHEYTRKILASGHHMISLINDVLDMSKIESGKTSLNIDMFSLPQFLEELYSVMMPQAKAKQQSFEFHTQGNLTEMLDGDKLRLNQILMNLLSNAIKYTQVGGTIDLTVRELPKTTPQYIGIQFIVTDNGIGISEEFIDKIFDTFTREENSTTSGIQGTGLGMAITKNLVDLMGGTIHVSSCQGKGSTFTVNLTFAVPSQKDPKELRTNFGISKILVADDELDICKNIHSVMSEVDIDVTYVTDGQAAVDAVVQAQENGDGFQVILLDWKMPEKDGVETARLIREKIHQDVPILILTSYDWSDIENKARAAGIDGFMTKPFFVSSFQHTLERMRADKEQGDTSAAADTGKNELENMMFLVAEDNGLNAEILSELLSLENASCEIAVNGQEALEMFVGSEPDKYDMILMDVQMPIMDGYEATRQIRACEHPRAKSIPIVAMTANAFAEDKQNAIDAGMNGHLSKPIDMGKTKEMIRLLKSNGEEAL